MKVEPNGKVTTYKFDSNQANAQLLEEDVTQGGVTTVTTYAWSNDGKLIGMNVGGQQRYPVLDAQGSVMALTDASGTITDTWTYDAFGNQTSRTGTTVNPFRYTSEYTDDTIGLQYNRARWYDPIVGRFNSIDQLDGKQAQPLTLNKYIYANSNPVTGRDPSGLNNLEEVNAVEDDVEILGEEGAESGASTERSFWQKACHAAASAAGPYADIIEEASRYEAHHVLQNAVMKRYAKNFSLLYDEKFAWAVSLFGGNAIKFSPHYDATGFQKRNRLGPTATIVEIMTQAKGALVAAGCSPEDADTLVRAAKDTLQAMNEGKILP